MGEVILVRHGETAWSLTGKHTSYTELPLTRRGEEQARSLAPLLAARRIALTITSPMLRAVRTAQLAGLGETFTDPELREWDYGAYEGVTTAHIHQERPDWDLWRDGVDQGPAEHPGETPQEVGARADRVLARVDKALRDADLDGEGGDVVLVAHAHFLRALTARRLGLDVAAGALFRLDVGSLSRLGTEHGRPVISAWNVTAEDRGA
jgi:probable phosphoglycerate mutase